MSPERIGVAARARRMAVALTIGLVATLAAPPSIAETMLPTNYNPTPQLDLLLAAAVSTTSDASAAAGSVLTPAATLRSVAALAVDTSTDVSTSTTTGVSLSGAVYWDADEDGVRTTSDYGIGEATVSISLSGTSAVLATVMTERDGSYTFTGLAAGNYTITLANPSEQPETPSPGDILDSHGWLVASGQGTAVFPDAIASIQLDDGETAINYDFPQLIYPTQLISKRMLINTMAGVPHSLPPTPVPEPSSLLLCMIGLVVGGSSQVLRAARNSRSRS